MYKLNFIEESERNSLLFIISSRGLYPQIIDCQLIVFDSDMHVVFKKNISDLCFNDVSDILGISVVNSKFVYYLLDIALENSLDANEKCKKKSL